jgi:Mn-dependent DtxR family transcriptional regulator
MILRKSGEDYLEAILVIEGRTGFVRSIDVAAELGFTKPSVSRAMSILREAGYILMDKEQGIQLTETGRAKAVEVYRRHRLLTRYFAEVLDVPLDVAEEDACRIEHVISKESMDRILQHMEKIAECDGCEKAPYKTL